jgi:tRNA (cmo5U34)-methyltransferase
MNQDQYIPEGRWEFNAEVARVFDDMISRSIPDYDTMRDLTMRLGQKFITHDSNVMDLGCSTGLGVESLINKNPECLFHLCDTSEPMLGICRAKYSGMENVIIEKKDITKELPEAKCSLILSCLTIQFTPIEYRQRIIQNVYDSLQRGGAFLFVEKVLGYSAVIDEAMKDEYYAIKRENSYTEEQIAGKRKSLEGTLVPVTEAANRQFLEAAGFRIIETYWRYLNFCGLIAIKR